MAARVPTTSTVRVTVCSLTGSIFTVLTASSRLREAVSAFEQPPAARATATRPATADARHGERAMSTGIGNDEPRRRKPRNYTTARAPGTPCKGLSRYDFPRTGLGGGLRCIAGLKPCTTG